MGNLNKWWGIGVVFLCQNMVAMEESYEDNCLGEYTPSSSYTPPSDLTQSTLMDATSSLKNAFSVAYEAADANFPTIFYIVHYSGYIQWESLIKHGLRENKFESRDALWVLSEYAKPKKLSEDGPQLVLDYFILHPLQDDNKAKLIESLLTEISFDTPSSSWFSTTRKEKRNALAELVELGAASPAALNAFKKIIKLLPICVIEDRDAVIREEQTSEAAGYLTYKYAERKYNLIQWLMREEGSLLKKNQHYVTAAIYLLKKKLASSSFIDDSMFDLATALRINFFIDQELFKKAASAYKKTDIVVE